MNFCTKDISSWSGFVDTLAQQRQSGWLYRGQRSDWPLATSFERSLNDWQIDLRQGPAIEAQIIRDFRRRYQGTLSERLSDTLYCIALMQHHGAPTRLLDWTYSPYVAAKFAIESGGKGAVIWCMNGNWINQAASCLRWSQELIDRNVDTTRNDSTFLPIYMATPPKYTFVFLENPMFLHERLIIQQGVFCCPANVGVSFIDNLKEMEGWEKDTSIIKINLYLNVENTRDFATMISRMNVNSAVLFPGLDGFASSFREQLFRYDELARNRTGLKPSQ